jgi:hypothetical protein
MRPPRWGQIRPPFPGVGENLVAGLAERRLLDQPRLGCREGSGIVHGAVRSERCRLDSGGSELGGTSGLSDFDGRSPSSERERTAAILG